MGRYPDAYQIEEMFANRRFPEKFHQYLAEPVDITVTGDDEFHLAGNYQSAQDFHDNVYGRGTTNVQKDTIKLDIRRVVGGGDSSVSKRFLPRLILYVPFSGHRSKPAFDMRENPKGHSTSFAVLPNSVGNLSDCFL